MKYVEYELLGNCFVDFNTEIKFEIAKYKVEGRELVRFTIPLRDDAAENSRLQVCTVKVLRSLKREGRIQFFVLPEGFTEGTTEAKFLTNKYYEETQRIEPNAINIFIKM